MTGLPEGSASSKSLTGSVSSSIDSCATGTTDSKRKGHNKSLWSSLFTSSFAVFDANKESSSREKPKECTPRSVGWTYALRRVITCNSMKRFQDVLGFNKPNLSSSTSEIWLLGVCYRVCPEGSTSDASRTDGYIAFLRDFSSRIWITYRKGFEAIGETKFTSDAHWGCMLRSSQMLISQALLFHYLGRGWRKPIEKPFDLEYLKILHQFGDSESSAFSIHNLLQAGKAYGLTPGSWLGPYAVCRAWESLAHAKRKLDDPEDRRQSFPFAVYIVSGDENGERGGAPVVCIDTAARLCSQFSRKHGSWAPLLMLVPLVLGLDKVNPLYIPSLCASFTFPQSLGILGGKPGASTYIVGVQDDQAIYLDPHEIQAVVRVSHDNPDCDPASYHCSSVLQVALSMLDSSIAIGFYCRNRDDFDDFCSRSEDLANQSNGAPLYTVSWTKNSSKRTYKGGLSDPVDSKGVFAVQSSNNPYDEMDDSTSNEDDWQLL